VYNADSFEPGRSAVLIAHSLQCLSCGMSEPTQATSFSAPAAVFRSPASTAPPARRCNLVVGDGELSRRFGAIQPTGCVLPS
jgi:hypothetical protein